MELLEKAQYWISKMNQFERIKGEWGNELINDYNMIFQTKEVWKNIAGCGSCAKRIYDNLASFVDRRKKEIEALSKLPLSNVEERQPDNIPNGTVIELKQPIDNQQNGRDRKKRTRKRK